MSLILIFVPGLTRAQNARRYVEAGVATTINSGLLVHYEVYASLEKGDSLPTIVGVEKMHILNTGERPIRQIQLFLYPNSYSSDSTSLNDQLLKARDLRLYFAKSSQLGRLSKLDIQVADAAKAETNMRLAVRDPAGTGENLMVSLPSELQPGDSITLQTPFSLVLPARLFDLGYARGVAYLKDWFLLLGAADDPVLATANLTIAVPDGDVLYVDGLQQTARTNGYQREGSKTYHLLVDPHATIAIKDEASTAAIEQGAPFPKASARGVYEGATAYFEKLLPGPLAAKRPLRPDSVLAQMVTARNGDYGSADKPLKPSFLFNLKEADTKRYLSFSPALGFNNYDQWMPGILIHNYGLPVTPFNFLLAPLYSTGDHALSGVGRLSYTKRYPLSAWQISLDGSSYAYNVYNSFSNASGKTTAAGKMRLLRVVPGVRFKWNPDPGNLDKEWQITAKSYFLRKDSWIIKGNDYGIGKATTTIGELTAALQDNRALYPYQLSVQLQGTDQFLRAGLTGNYFLNYDAQGKGLQLRGFGGKFFYLKEKNIQSGINLGNYYFNLSGATGSQDFTNSDYFVGRSEYSGWMSQQMTTSQGFFKVSTPYRQDPVGWTDNWLAAINLTTDLPDGINPLSVLPFRLPLRVFADIGTYSNLWSENPAAGRFLYDAGFQVSVLKEAVTIYFPLLYSKIYRDTYKSIGDLGGFAQRIRFSVNLGSLLPKRLERDLKW